MGHPDFVSERLKRDNLRTVTLGLVDILKVAGFDPTLPTKLVRHQDRRYPVEELRRRGWLELYQSYQGKPKFHGVKQIVSFYGLSAHAQAFSVCTRFSATTRPAKGAPLLRNGARPSSFTI